MKKRLLSMVLALALLCTMMPLASFTANAATELSTTPNPRVEYGYTTETPVGTIRYIQQSDTGDYFYSEYWGQWVSQAGTECGTSSISMSLSYIGINVTPAEILGDHGQTYFGENWGGATAKSYTYDMLSVAMDNYINGNGKYSPPIIHLYAYSGNHHVVLVGKIGNNTYQVLDPATTKIWSLTINGATATYTHPQNENVVTDTINWLVYDGKERYDDIYQYYNPNAYICTDLSNVTKTTYASYGTGTINTSSAWLKSLPCSAGTNAASENVRSEAMTKNEKVTITQLILNTAGNYWYKVKADADGLEGYLYAGDVDFSAKWDAGISEPVYPTEVDLGKYFIIGGTVYANNTELYEVTGAISGAKSFSKTVSASGSYRLKDSSIDAALLFNELPAGTYTYSVKANCRNYYSKGTSLLEKTYNKTVHSNSFTVGSHTCDHSYSSRETTVPTCTEGGVMTYTCTKCGYSYTESTPANGHAYGGWSTTKSPTCTDSGTQQQMCYYCGNIETQSIAATGHSFGSWTTTKDPTCTTNGTQKRTCGKCSETQTQSISYIGHSLTYHAAKSPTCTASGNYAYWYCSGCGKYFSNSSATAETTKSAMTRTALGHHYSNGVCTRCGALAPNVIDVGYCGGEGDGSNLQWILYNDGTLEIFGTGAMADYQKKENVPWYDVSESISALTLYEGIESIGNFAFANWDGDYPNLSGVLDIPATVTRIGKEAFASCEFDGELTLPAGITELDSGAFMGCSGFTGTLEIPGTLDCIEFSTFEDCSGINEIVFGEGIKRIEDSAFRNCGEINGSIVIPSSVEYLGYYTMPRYKNIYFKGNAPDYDIGFDAVGFASTATLYYTLGTTGWRDSSGYNSEKMTWYGYKLRAWCDHVNTTKTSIHDGEHSHTTTYICDCCGEVIRVETGPCTDKNYDYICDICGGGLCDHTDVTTSYIVEGGERHTISEICICGIVMNARTENCVDEDRDAACDLCGGDCTCKHEETTVAYTPGEEISTHIYVERCSLCEEELLSRIEPCTDSFHKENGTYIDANGICDYCKGAPIVGQCGDDVVWAFDGYTKCLTISGIGAMWDYDHLYLYEEDPPLMSVMSVSGEADLQSEGGLTGEASPWYCLTTIEKIVIEEGVTYIGTVAFAGCRMVNEVTIPVSVTSIGGEVFSNCSGLTDVYYAGTTDEWAEISIGDGNEELLSATLHAICSHSKTSDSYVQNDDGMHTVTVICDNCGATVSTETAACCDDDADQKCDYCGAVVESENTGIASGYCGGEGDGTNLSWVLTEDGSLAISGTGAMANYTSGTAPWYSYKTSIKTAIIGNGVTTLGEYAFSGCKALSTVTLPQGLVSIGGRAFVNCSGLIGVTIPNGLTEVGNFAFAYCSGLTGIAIPESVTNIGVGAFAFCSGLQEMQVAQENTVYVSIDDVVYTKDQKILHTYPAGKKDTSYTIKSGATLIERYAFSSASALINIVIPDGITEIGKDAFNGCVALTTMTIPDSVAVIGKNVFASCTNLKTIVLGTGIANIEEGAFKTSTSLTDVYYYGSQEQWSEVSVSANNSKLADAEFHYMSVMYTANTDGTHTVQDVCSVCGATLGEAVIFVCTDEDMDIKCDDCGAVVENENSVIASGYCGGEGDGTNLTWELYADGTFYVKGSGRMKNYATDENIPWDNYREKITHLLSMKE